MSKIEVNKAKYLLMCIDILKAPEEPFAIPKDQFRTLPISVLFKLRLTKDFAEEEILRLSQ